MEKKDFTKGQAVWLKIINLSNAARSKRLNMDRDRNPEKWLLESSVISVGKKYLTVGKESCPWANIKFDMDAGFCQYPYLEKDYELFLDKKSAVDSLKADWLYMDERNHFSSYKNKTLTLRQMKQVSGAIHQADMPLNFGKHAENLIEIIQTYDMLCQKLPQLSDIDSLAWKQMFVAWANEFDEVYEDREFDGSTGNDYYLMIASFASLKILDFGNVSMERWYFTFGTDAGFPFQDTYLVVFADSEKSAIEKFCAAYPDRHEGVVNCAFWYSEEKWRGSACEKAWNDKLPEEVIV
ncbi:MAG: hypothetical protein LUE14_07845 [Clostridiales bacterium]|nr:hypothetical protein [Clostridiales bacterium]